MPQVDLRPVRVCPACARRWTMLIDPECPVCDGTGTLVLGAATTIYAEEVASRAVEYAVESAARRVLAAVEGAAAIPLARRAITASVARMRLTALLAPDTLRTGPLPRTPLTRREIHDRARNISPDYEPGDAAALDAPPLDFDPDDRPLAHGGIPGFSLAGYICHTSRASDPLDPLLTSTRERVMARTVTTRQARVLARAVEEAPIGVRA